MARFSLWNKENKTEKISNVLGFRLFPANQPFLEKIGFSATSVKAATVIEKCRHLTVSVRDEKIKKDLNNIITKSTHIIQLLSKHAENAAQGPDNWEIMDFLAVEDEISKIQTIMLSLPQRTQSESSFSSISYKIAGTCFYLLVLSSAITLGATFGAWYFGYLTTTYFMSMLMSSLAYFDIPTFILGAVSYGVSGSEHESSSDLNSLEDDVSLFFKGCRELVNNLLVEYGEDNSLPGRHSPI